MAGSVAHVARKWAATWNRQSSESNALGDYNHEDRAQIHVIGPSRKLRNVALQCYEDRMCATVLSLRPP